MAVSIDTVYQKVLAIANKEQRGYITPQEFNLFADQAQMDIFEQYFYDINQFNRLHGNNTEYSDMLNLLEEKISIFKNSKLLDYANNIPYHDKFTQLYRLGTLETEYGQAQKVTYNEYLNMKNSALLKPTLSRPVFIEDEKGYKVYPNFKQDVTCKYIKKPETAKWGYNVIGGNALHDSTISTDFELHPSEENNLIIKILALAGIAIKDLNIYQVATQEDNKNIQQEKQ
jgi:hypothetical protein